MELGFLTSMLTLDQIAPGTSVIVGKVGGARSFRRRLMELGIIPGIEVEMLRIAPFGDPLELTVRGCNLSIRAAEAQQVQVEHLKSPSTAPARAVKPWEPARSGAVSGLAKSAP